MDFSQPVYFLIETFNFNQKTFNHYISISVFLMHRHVKIDLSGWICMYLCRYIYICVYNSAYRYRWYVVHLYSVHLFDSRLALSRTLQVSGVRDPPIDYYSNLPLNDGLQDTANKPTVFLDFRSPAAMLKKITIIAILIYEFQLLTFLFLSLLWFFSLFISWYLYFNHWSGCCLDLCLDQNVGCVILQASWHSNNNTSCRLYIELVLGAPNRRYIVVTF